LLVTLYKIGVDQISVLRMWLDLDFIRYILESDGSWVQDLGDDD